MKRKVLLFDFDGVIVDTFKLCLSINRRFHTALSSDEYRRWFEGNIYDRPKRKNWKKGDDADFFRMYADGIFKIKPVKGIKKALRELNEKYILVIVSSAINSPITEYLEKYGLLKYFSKVFGADMHESKVEKIKIVFKEYGAAPEDCLFITDTLGDMREAHKTGVRALGISWGYHLPEKLQNGNTVAIAKKPADILTEVKKYFGN